MQITFNANDLADIARASAVLAAIGAALSGSSAAVPAAPAVAQEATKAPKAAKTKRPDPVETYNAMAAAAGAPVVETAAEPPTTLAEEVAAVEQQVAPAASTSDELTFEQKCAAIVNVVRKRAATGVMGMAETMALISWSAQDGMLRAMSPEKVDVIHAKAIAL